MIADTITLQIKNLQVAEANLGKFEKLSSTAAKPLRYVFNLDGQNGYVVPRRNHKKMAEKILAITGDVTKQKEMGQESIKIASKHEISYAYELLLEKYQSLMDS